MVTSWTGVPRCIGGGDDCFDSANRRERGIPCLDPRPTCGHDADHQLLVHDTSAIPQCGWRRCIAVRMKRNDTHVPVSIQRFPLAHCPQKVHTGPSEMKETESQDAYVRREWRNTRGELHRTTGPAVERWTVLPGGGHVLSYQVWCLNGKAHREGRPAVRRWHVAENGTRVLVREEWVRHGRRHRVDGPSWRRWTVEPGGTRTLTYGSWRVNNKLHRADGPACDERWFYWHDRKVRQEDLPWLRRGHGLLAAFTVATQQGGGSGVFPAWSRDTRVEMTGADSVSNTPRTYRSAVGGSVLLCV